MITDQQVRKLRRLDGQGIAKYYSAISASENVAAGRAWRLDYAAGDTQ